jgi:hypothetical protein
MQTFYNWYRTKINETEYGFDFDLFAEIKGDECNAITQHDMIIVNIQKKIPAEWMRLLSSLAKVLLIKINFIHRI